MGRPPQSENRDTRQALVDTGLEVFAEKGYFGTSLRDIARAVGVRESALYHYFPSKEALFEAVLVERPGGRFVADELLEVPLEDARAALTKLGLGFITHFSKLREQKLYRILMSDGMRLASEGRINLVERFSAGASRLALLMGRLVREGHLRPAPPELLAMEFFAPFGLWRQWQAAQPKHPAVVDPRAFVRFHVDHFLRAAGA